MDILEIPAEEKPRMDWYSSIYSSQYLVAKYNYESRRKKWKIANPKPNWFSLKDSNNVITHVYYSTYIKNCECDEFINDETGSCQHISTIENNRYHLRRGIGRDDKIIFVDVPQGTLNKLDKFSTPVTELDSTIIAAKYIGFETTPSVSKFLTRKLKQQSAPRTLPTLGDFSLFSGITLYNHQKESIDKMITGGRTILTLKMGLGKTICALYCCKALNSEKIIIVCPNSLKLQWQKEINRFSIGTSLVVSKGTDIEKYKDQNYLILSYEMLNGHPELLQNNYDIAIIDEIQKIKNSESKTWDTISKLKSEFVFALSGTPIQNSVTDLISILKVISPEEFNPEWKFFEAYCQLSRTRITGWNPSKLPDLQRKLSSYIISPKINWNNFKLPSKAEYIIKCKLDSTQKGGHDAALEAAKILLSKSHNYPLTVSERARLNGLLLHCRRSVSDGRLISNKAGKSDRFAKIEDLILAKVSSGEKVVVYSDWIDCLKLLMPTLEQHNIQYTIFTGELTDKNKNKNLDLFISDPNVKVFLSTDSGGLGVDGLQLASKTLLHIEDIWNPMKLAQREGRLIRALQSAQVVDVYYFDSDTEIEKMLKANRSRKNQIISELAS